MQLVFAHTVSLKSLVRFPETPSEFQTNVSSSSMPHGGLPIHRVIKVKVVHWECQLDCTNGM